MGNVQHCKGKFFSGFALLKTLFEWSMKFSLIQRFSTRLCQRILNYIRGEGIGNPNVNGEFRLLRVLTTRFADDKLIFFDVGANLGEWTKSAFYMCNNLIVYAFEPSLSTFLELQKTIAKLNFNDNIKVINAALSNKSSDDTTLYLAGDRLGTNSLHFRRDVTVAGSEKVKIIRGDSFCNEAGIKHIDFIKIDTEGHEMAVLEGFAGMLLEKRVNFIQFEYGRTWIDARRYLDDAFKYLLPKGYKIGKIHPHGVEFFEEYDQSQETFIYANYIAFLPELAQKLDRI